MLIRAVLARPLFWLSPAPALARARKITSLAPTTRRAISYHLELAEFVSGGDPLPQPETATTAPLGSGGAQRCRLRSSTGVLLAAGEIPATGAPTGCDRGPWPTRLFKDKGRPFGCWGDTSSSSPTALGLLVGSSKPSRTVLKGQ